MVQSGGRCDSGEIGERELECGRWFVGRDDDTEHALVQRRDECV